MPGGTQTVCENDEATIERIETCQYRQSTDQLYHPGVAAGTAIERIETRRRRTMTEFPARENDKAAVERIETQPSGRH